MSREHASPELANLIAMLVSAACCLAAAQIATPLVLGISLGGAGACWMVVIANNNVTAQSSPFTISALTAQVLSFTVQPTNTAAGAAIKPRKAPARNI